MRLFCGCPLQADLSKRHQVCQHSLFAGNPLTDVQTWEIVGICHALLQSPAGIPVCRPCAKVQPAGLPQEPCRRRPTLLAPALSQTFYYFLDSLINADNHWSVPDDVLADLCFAQLDYQFLKSHQILGFKR